MKLTVLPPPYIEPPNEPPQFADETLLSGFLLTTKTNEPASWSYIIPETFDPNDDTVTVTVDVKEATFVEFSDGALKIEDLSDESVQTGVFSIDVILDDGELSVTQTISLSIGTAPTPDKQTNSETAEASETDNTADTETTTAT